MEEDISPASLNVTGESSSKVKLVVNAYGCFVESDERNEGHKITKCLSRGGGGGGGGKRQGLGPRNDVLTTCKAITLRYVQRIIAAFFHGKYF